MRLSFTIALLLHESLAWKQMNAGQISGSVEDRSGSVLAGAKVQAKLAERGQIFGALSNRAGEYLFAQLPIGSYSLSVSAANFKISTFSRIELHAGDRARRDFTLEVGDRTEMVTVLGDNDSVPLEPADIRDVIRRRQLTELPVKSRQFLDLAMLSPGVVRPPGGTRGDAMQQAGNLVDVRYTPEFGGKSGAVINVLTKFGSTQFARQSVRIYSQRCIRRKEFLRCRGCAHSPYRQNQLGGPVRSNKTFFFASYKGQRIRKSLTQTLSIRLSCR